ncbi:MAG: hypothetical protein PHD20_05425 [Clostridia bacterium]|nr:hypothetical protein [Clostridia bacterium]MDD4779025.1 hypothetical protein [Tissierellia bacterium]
MKWLKDFFSGDEKRVSSLIIFAIILTGVAIYSVIKFTDIPNNLQTVLIWLYGFIAGGSSISLLPSLKGGNNSNDSSNGGSI